MLGGLSGEFFLQEPQVIFELLTRFFRELPAFLSLGVDLWASASVVR